MRGEIELLAVTAIMSRFYRREVMAYSRNSEGSKNLLLHDIRIEQNFHYFDIYLSTTNINRIFYCADVRLILYDPISSHKKKKLLQYNMVRSHLSTPISALPSQHSHLSTPISALPSQHSHIRVTLGFD
jgi:hypothetical protein